MRIDEFRGRPGKKQFREERTRVLAKNICAPAVSRKQRRRGGISHLIEVIALQAMLHEFC